MSTTTKPFHCGSCGITFDLKPNILRLTGQGIFKNRTKDVKLCDACAKSIKEIQLVVRTGAIERIV